MKPAYRARVLSRCVTAATLVASVAGALVAPRVSTHASDKPAQADEAVRPGAMLWMDHLLETVSRQMPPGAHIAFLYLREDTDTTAVVRVEPAVFLVNFQQKSPRFIVVGFYNPGRKPGPQPSYEQDLAIVLLRQSAEGKPFHKVWQSEYIARRFCPPDYLSVSYGDGRLTIRANRSGGGSLWRGTQTSECYEWKETGMVTVKKDFGHRSLPY